jgi:hypothetical protein
MAADTPGPGGAPVSPTLGVTTSEYDATATILALV